MDRKTATVFNVRTTVRNSQLASQIKWGCKVDHKKPGPCGTLLSQRPFIER